MAVKKKILMIEDEQSQANNIKIALEDKYEFSHVPTGTEGLELAKSLQPDLILLDINLPDISGVEILSKLKADENTASLEVLVMTNLSDSETVSQILEAGGKEYIVKSDWGVAEVIDKITEMLSG